MIELQNPQHAYFIGFAQADGSLYSQSRNRGKFTIEIQHDDREILEKFANIINCKTYLSERTRNTNFKNQYRSCTLAIYDFTFRKEIEKYMCCGKKSESIRMPKHIIKKDYFRGIIDGDGSVGFIASGIPFISLVTKSDELASEYLKYIKEITGKIKKLLKIIGIMFII